MIPAPVKNRVLYGAKGIIVLQPLAKIYKAE